MSQTIAVQVPDIGGYHDVPVIDVYVKPGDVVHLDDTLVTLESDKATMDVPSTVAGTVVDVVVKNGDRVSAGSVIVMVDAAQAQPAAAPAQSAPAPAPAAAPAQPPVAATTPPTQAPVAAAPQIAQQGGRASHASPSVRQFARELGVDVGLVSGSGPKGRITQQDVQAYVKRALSGAAGAAPQASGAGLNLLPWPQIDFTKFGPIDTQARTRIQNLAAANLARNWVMIPAVTYHEDADVTDLEAFRQQLNREHEKAGVKITMLAFLLKACVAALQKFPQFNSALDGETLVLKRYFHLGFAADTPHGLVVPVIRDADRKGIVELAQETAELAQLARDGKLKPDQMQGACFTISSLGGIGGTGFAPIINAPEVAILGVSKTAMKPVWNGSEFVPRLTLPLSLTADHRVIDGALATRFNVYLAQLLADFRRAML